MKIYLCEVFLNPKRLTLIVQTKNDTVDFETILIESSSFLLTRLIKIL